MKRLGAPILMKGPFFWSFSNSTFGVVVEWAFLKGRDPGLRI